MTRPALALLLVMLSIAAPGSAQELPAGFPTTPAATVFREWLRVVNSNDSAAIRAYAVQYEAERPRDPESVDEAVRNIRGVARQSGGIRVLVVRNSAPARLELLVQDSRGTRLIMFLEVSQLGNEWRVSDIGLRQAPAPGAPPQGGPGSDAAPPPPLPRGMPDAVLAESVAARAEALAAAGDLEGALLIARLDGTPLLRRAWGMADRARNVRNTAETRFALASLGKMFTATAIGQLVDAGRVALDSPLVRYLPDYPNRAFASRATVRQLLNHTSGLGSYWGPEFQRRRTTLLTPADHLPLFVNEELPFEPGAQFRYSNAGYQVLGLIIERMSGQSFYDYVQRNIFARAGMASTGYYDPQGRAEGAAIGYARGRDGQLAPNDDSREVRGGPAGGGLSTVDDLARFFRALSEGRLMRRETVAEFTRGQSDSGRYGLGFFTVGAGRSAYFGHNGGAPGMATWGLVWPEQGVLAITLTNRDPGALGRLQQPMMGAIAGR